MIRAKYPGKPTRTPSPIDSDTSTSSSSTALKEYRPIGRCRSCLNPIESLQPGGLSTRHISDHVPIDDCKRRKQDDQD